MSEPSDPFVPSGLDSPPPGFGPRHRGRIGDSVARHPRRWLGGMLALGVLCFVIGPFVYFKVQGNAPSRLKLPTVQGTSAKVRPGPLAGQWKVSAGSQAGFRAHETLFGQSHTAVGRTTGVTGGVELSGNKVVGADFTVDMKTLNTDQEGRNVQIHDWILKTGKFPTSQFRLTKPIDLPSDPAVGQVLKLTASGRLTLRATTLPVTFTVSMERLPNGTVDLNAEIPIHYKRWGIPQPDFEVAQVGNTGTVEVLLHLTRESTH